MKFLTVVLSSSILVACGGGGSGAPTALNPAALNPAEPNPAVPNPAEPNPAVPNPAEPNPAVPNPAVPNPAVPNPAVSPASAELAKYEGVWQGNCVDHLRVTKTFLATGSTTFSVATKEEYFDYADCTGAVVATGSYGVPDENVQYAPALAASVTLLTGENIFAENVNPATSKYAVASFSITGSGVKSTELIGTTLYARIEYAGGYVVTPHPALNGQTTQGALLLRNNELLALVPIVGFTNSYRVNHQYIR